MATDTIFVHDRTGEDVNSFVSGVAQGDFPN